MARPTQDYIGTATIDCGSRKVKVGIRPVGTGIDGLWALLGKVPASTVKDAKVASELQIHKGTYSDVKEAIAGLKALSETDATDAVKALRGKDKAAFDTLAAWVSAETGGKLVADIL